VTRGAPAAQAYRFVYGKAVEESGAKVLDGFEHRTTTMSKGMPMDLIDRCQASALLGSRLIPQVVHKDQQARGALMFRPAVGDGARWMLATCVRARPESGEGGLSRTYTQLTTFVFNAQDWALQAPRLLWNAGVWLRTDPDLKSDYERYRHDNDWPLTEFGPELLPEAPPSERAALPPPGTPLWHLLWRLAAALERPADNLLCGAADGIKSVESYLRTLSWLAALLPPPLRIYLTAAAGFAAEERPFALQFLPEAPAMPGAEPGLLERFAGQVRRHEETLDRQRWHGFWEPPVGGRGAIADAVQALEALDAWTTAEDARRQMNQVFDRLSSEHSVTDLKAWLDGEVPEPPPRPELHQPHTGRLWLEALTDRLNGCLADAEAPGRQAEGTDPAATAGVGLARAVWQLTTLVDIDPAPAQRQRRQADYWAAAWHALVKDAGQDARDRRARLRWSALMASALADDDKPEETGKDESWPPPPGRNPLAQTPEKRAPIGVGVITSLRELRALTTALRQANAAAGADAAALQAALKQAQPAFGRRIEALRERAEALLVRDPLCMLDLAAAAPGLFTRRNEKPLLDDDRRRATVLTIADASALLAEARGKDPATAQLFAEMSQAASTVAEASYGVKLGDPATLREALATRRNELLKSLLERYWRWALAPETRIDEITSAGQFTRPGEEAIVATPYGSISQGHRMPSDRVAAATPTAPQLWRAAILLVVIDAIKNHGIADPLRALLQQCVRACGEAFAPDSDLSRPASAAQALLQPCLAAIDAASADQADLAVGLLQAVPDLRRLALEPGSGSRDMDRPIDPLAAAADQVEVEIADSLYAQLVDAIEKAAPQAALERVLPVFNAGLARLIDALGRAPPLPRLAHRLLGIAADLIEQKAIALRTGMPRAPVLDLFALLERFAAALPPPPAAQAAWRSGSGSGYEPRIESDLDRLARLLARCVLLWFAADPQRFQLAWEPKQIDAAPIRRRLAAELKFPRCTYFAGLTPAQFSVAKALPPRPYDTNVAPPDEIGIDPREGETIKRLKLKDPAERMAAKQLISTRATTLWRRLFEQGIWEKQDVDQLLNDDSRREVLDALDAIATEAADAYAALIDADTRFVVDFYRSLRDNKNPRLDTRTAMPAALQAMLLTNGADLSNCYPIRLGRAIATSRARLRQPLVELFEHRESNARCAKRVLLCGRPWERCKMLADTEWRDGLLRTLFLLALISSDPARANRADRREAIGRGQIERALKAPDQRATQTLEDAMHRLREAAGGDHAPDFPFAFTWALSRAGVEALPGWPLDCKPK
jgi:hypothetical protein